MCRPGPLEKSPLVCWLVPACWKNHPSFADLAWPVGKIISRAMQTSSSDIRSNFRWKHWLTKNTKISLTRALQLAVEKGNLLTVWSFSDYLASAHNSKTQITNKDKGAACKTDTGRAFILLLFSSKI